MSECDDARELIKSLESQLREKDEIHSATVKDMADSILKLESQIENYQGMIADLQLSLRNQVALAEERGMRLVEAEARLRANDEIAAKQNAHMNDIVRAADELAKWGKEIQHTELCITMTPYRGCTCGKEELDDALAAYEKIRGLK